MKGGRYAFNSIPQYRQQAGPLGALGDFATKKAMNYGINAAIPGGGIAAEAAQTVLPTLLNDGGSVTDKMEAYKLWLKNNPKAADALAKARGYNKGGSIYKQLPPIKPGSVWTPKLPNDGFKKPQYKEMGGLTAGPLGMSDMLEAGRGKDVSKVTYKKKGGEIEDVMEINYHAPLSGKGE